MKVTSPTRQQGVHSQCPVRDYAPDGGVFPGVWMMAEEYFLFLPIWIPAVDHNRVDQSGLHLCFPVLIPAGDIRFFSI